MQSAIKITVKIMSFPLFLRVNYQSAKIDTIVKIYSICEPLSPKVFQLYKTTANKII